MKAHARPRLSARLLAWVLLLAGLVPAHLAATGQTFRVLYSFTGAKDGGNPAPGLTLGGSGSLYGEAMFGAEPGCARNAGCGTLFELALNSGKWSEIELYSFTGGADGGNPSGGLVFDKKGNLYGVTISAGTAGCGVAFELNPDSGGWTENVLHDFGGTGGCSPIAGLIFDTKGNLYSTLPTGQVYQLTKSTGRWEEKILYTSNGEPGAAVIFDRPGNLYSTTPLGGTGGGTIFELMHGNWKERTLYEFAGPGGGEPEAALVFDEAGNLYGQTLLGGKYNMGVVFKLVPGAKGKWKETVLHSFKGGSDGEYPISSVPVFDKAGNLYGTTGQGGGTGCGGKGCGTVFKLAPGKGGHWKETVLHRFTDSDGRWPYYGVVIDKAGNLYGTTGYGGNPGCFQNLGCGVVFEITP